MINIKHKKMTKVKILQRYRHTDISKSNPFGTFYAPGSIFEGTKTECDRIVEQNKGRYLDAPNEDKNGKPKKAETKTNKRTAKK